MKMAVITISREPGTFGEEVAARVAGRLGFVLVDKARLVQLWSEVDLDEARLGSVDERVPWENNAVDAETEAAAGLLPDLIVQMAEDHDLVVVGRGAQALFRDRPGTLHVRIIASRTFRARQLQHHQGLSPRASRQELKKIEGQRSRYLRLLYRLNWTDSGLYDMTLRMDRLSMKQAVNLIVASGEEMEIHQVPRHKIVENLLPELPESRANGHFANESEQEFASFLEFYGIPFDYEPRTFTLESNADGDVMEAFTPDFYLPEQDLYIELTTMKQSLVTRKNRKVRKLRQLYPKINIRIFYQRDYFRLMAKYGLLAGETNTSAAGTDNRRPDPAASPGTLLQD
jgi:cytidylate kinase